MNRMILATLFLFLPLFSSSANAQIEATSLLSAEHRVIQDSHYFLTQSPLKFGVIKHEFSQSFVFFALMEIFGVTFSSASLIPLIANLVLQVSGSLNARQLRGWGITGIVTGSLGVVTSLLGIPLIFGNITILAGWVFAWIASVLVSGVSIALGIRSVILAKRFRHNISRISLPSVHAPASRYTSVEFKF